MAFNINHGLGMGRFESTAPNGEILNAQTPSAARNPLSEEPSNLRPQSVSSRKTHRSEDGSAFTYVIVNDSFVRIEKARPAGKVLVMPSSIEGREVLALGTEVCAEEPEVEEILCPPKVREIGPCAFRLCPDLRRVVLPRNTEDYKASWLQHCDSLEDLTLPGRLKTLSRAVFDHPALRRLVLGPDVEQVEPGACEKTALETLVIDEGNTHLATDGPGIYSSGFRGLLAIAKPVEFYEVQEGCQVIGRKAAKGLASLKAIELPSSLEVIEPYAFAQSGLEGVVLPGRVRSLGERCFFHCSDLRSAGLNEGLESIGEAAFAESGLRALAIPASVRELGTSIIEKSAVIPSGSSATFSISAGSPTFLFDDAGGIYRREADGLHLVQLIDPEAPSYRVLEGAVAVDPYGFAFHDAIEEAVIPEGVQTLGASAFRVCRRLRAVSLPSTLRSIGKEAFLDTVLESITLPSSLEELGEDALVTAGAHHSSEPHSLYDIRVAPGNGRFYVESGVLCRRGDHGDRALMFTDALSDVAMPPEVTSIAPYAFNNARHIRTLALGPRLKTIAVCGMTTWSAIERLDIELAEPEEGRTRFTLRFPAIDRARHELSLALGGSSWVNVPEIYRHYDSCLAGARDYRNGEGISPYEQLRRILGRLEDPVFLTPVNRSILERVVRLNLDEMCRDIVRNDDRDAFNALADHGFLDGETVEEALAAIQPLQDASMTGHLLEMKRLRFRKSAFDFDL